MCLFLTHLNTKNHNLGYFVTDFEIVLDLISPEVVAKTISSTSGEHLIGKSYSICALLLNYGPLPGMTLSTVVAKNIIKMLK